jgi:GntR family transcriptional regulator/MocR family aminotransferase
MKSRQSWADLYAFEVTRANDTPLFQQLYLQLRSAILSRRLRPGTKLPSTRQLASQLGVSRAAAVAAYEQLLAEGYTSGRHGSGTYISSDLPEQIGENAQRRKKPVAAIKSSAAQMQSFGDFVDVTVQSDERPFNLGRTLVDTRTVELWRKISARTFRSLSPSHLGYSDPRGTIGLRQTICDYFCRRLERCDAIPNRSW